MRTELELKYVKLEEQNLKLQAEVSALEVQNSQLAASSSRNRTNDIDFKAIFSSLLDAKWLIASISLTAVIFSVTVALSLPNKYKSTAIVVPSSQTSGSGGLAKLAGQFGGLASLAGISLGESASDNKAVIAMKLMKTWGFLETFVLEHNIQAEIYAAKSWDAESRAIIYDSDIYSTEKSKWLASSYMSSEGPSSWKVFKKFDNMIGINQDKSNGLITISVEHYSPDFAKKVVDDLIIEINKYMQIKDKKEAEESIEFLKSKISETNIAEMQNVFYQLIEEQTKTLMLAEVNDEYALKVISKPKVPEEKSRPSRGLIVIFGSFFGMFISVVVALVKTTYFKSQVSQC